MFPDLGGQAAEPPVRGHRKSAPGLLRSWRLRRAVSPGLASAASTQTDSETAKGSHGLNLLFEPSDPRLDMIFVSVRS